MELVKYFLLIFIIINYILFKFLATLGRTCENCDTVIVDCNKLFFLKK